MTVAYYVTAARFRTDVSPSGWYPNVSTDALAVGESYSTVFIDDHDGPPNFYILKLEAPPARHNTFFPDVASKVGDSVAQLKGRMRADVTLLAAYLRIRDQHRYLRDRGAPGVPDDALDLVRD